MNIKIPFGTWWLIVSCLVLMDLQSWYKLVQKKRRGCQVFIYWLIALFFILFIYLLFFMFQLWNNLANHLQIIKAAFWKNFGEHLLTFCSSNFVKELFSIQSSIHFYHLVNHIKKKCGKSFMLVLASCRYIRISALQWKLFLTVHLSAFFLT